ncbi:MAG TPA: response regulator [Chitinophagaceae bacterium]|nr:response regulator [Chitinophagaceae bacterium]
MLLAEDDEDDFLLFQEALNENKQTVNLEWVKDGDELMNVLKQSNGALPDMIFLDINMPRKNGFECLSEIRRDEEMKKLPVIIFSTSNDRALVNWMYNAGANLYLNKPAGFRELRENIQKAIAMDWDKQGPYPPLKDFMLG